MTLLEYFSLFISVIFGGGIAFYLKKNNKEILQLVLSFSGAYILGVTVLHLMPEAFNGGGHQQGLYVLLGFFIQLFLEQFSGGVEHGHIHASKNASMRFAIMIMIGLCIHAFMEGMPLSTIENLGNHEGHNHGHGHKHLLLGIILHKAPAAFALVLLLLMSNFKKITVLSCLLIFALMSPLGAAVAQFSNWSPEVNKIVLAIVIGSFLHISTTIIFEMDGGSHKVSLKKFLAIVFGTGMALLTLL